MHQGKVTESFSSKKAKHFGPKEAGGPGGMLVPDTGSPRCSLDQSRYHISDASLVSLHTLEPSAKNAHKIAGMQL